MKKLILGLGLLALNVNVVKAQSSISNRNITIGVLGGSAILIGIGIIDGLSRNNTTNQPQQQIEPITLEQRLDKSRTCQVLAVLSSVGSGLCLRASMNNAIEGDMNGVKLNKNAATGFGLLATVFGTISVVEKIKWEDGMTERAKQHDKEIEQLKLKLIENNIQK
jgi:hypothetical protein